MTDPRLPEYLNHPADRTVFGQRPLLMVPTSGPLPPCKMGETRLLAARDGIYVETRSLALHATLRVEPLQQELPYGTVGNDIELAGGVLPGHLVDAFILHARDCLPNETAALITLGEDDFYHLTQTEQIDAGPGHVRSAELADDAALAFDIHSHGRFSAYFSATDDESDHARVGPYIALVVGNLDHPDGVTLAARLCVSPYLIPIDPAWVIGPPMDQAVGQRHAGTAGARS